MSSSKARSAQRRIRRRFPLAGALGEVLVASPGLKGQRQTSGSITTRQAIECAPPFPVSLGEALVASAAGPVSPWARPRSRRLLDPGSPGVTHAGAIAPTHRRRHHPAVEFTSAPGTSSPPRLALRAGLEHPTRAGPDASVRHCLPCVLSPYPFVLSAAPREAPCRRPTADLGDGSLLSCERTRFPFPVALSRRGAPCRRAAGRRPPSGSRTSSPVSLSQGERTRARRRRAARRRSRAAPWRPPLRHGACGAGSGPPGKVSASDHMTTCDQSRGPPFDSGSQRVLRSGHRAAVREPQGWSSDASRRHELRTNGRADDRSREGQHG